MIGFIIPSHQPDLVFTHALDDEGMTHLRALRGALHFLLVLNGPEWTAAAIKTAKEKVQRAGFDVSVARIPNQGNPPSMCALRLAGAKLLPDAELMLFGDHDFVYTAGTPQYPSPSGVRYRQAIRYMKQNPWCAYVMCAGSLGGSVQREKIAPTSVGLISTSRGLFIRNIYKGAIFPKGATKLAGTLEESVACYYVMESDPRYFGAKQFNNPTRHQMGKIVAHDEKDLLHSQSVMDANLQQFIRDRYNDPQWTHNSRKFPKGLKQCTSSAQA